MSANACVAYYGLRFEVSPNEINALELRSDSRMLAARKARLRHYWGNFGAPGERYLLFVGACLGILGPENSLEVVLGSPEVEDMLSSTKTKLAASGLEGEPSLYLQWLPDV